MFQYSKKKYYCFFGLLTGNIAGNSTPLRGNIGRHFRPSTSKSTITFLFLEFLFPLSFLTSSLFSYAPLKLAPSASPPSSSFLFPDPISAFGRKRKKKQEGRNREKRRVNGLPSFSAYCYTFLRFSKPFPTFAAKKIGKSLSSLDSPLKEGAWRPSILLR